MGVSKKQTTNGTLAGYSLQTSYERVVPVNPERAHELFVKIAWWQAGMLHGFGIKKVAEGDKENSTGSKRLVLGMYLEEVLKGEKGKYIEYKVHKAIPFKEHLGRIDFHQAGPGHTRIVWTVNYDPYPGTALISRMCTSSFKGFLDYVEAAAEKEAGVKKGWTSKHFLMVLVLLYVAYSTMVKVYKISISKPQPPPPGYLRTLELHYQNTSSISDTMRKHRFLIIGGTGFTGSSIVHELRTRGAMHIRILGRRLPPAIEYPYGHTDDDHYPIAGVDYVRGDFTNKDILRQAMDGVDIVYHTAAYYGNPVFGSKGEDTEGKLAESINFEGMKAVVEIAKEKKVKAVIYTSSIDTTFIEQHMIRINETHPFASLGRGAEQRYADGDLTVGDFYARTKIKGERYLLENDKQSGLRTLSLRPNGIYGPGETTNFPKAVLPGWFLGFFPFYFNFEQKTLWTCVGSLAFAHTLAAHKLLTNPDEVSGRAFFITDEEELSNAAVEIFSPIMNAIGVPFRPWIKIPESVLLAFAEYSEQFAYWLKTNYKITFPVFLTRKEVLKTLVTHTHDISEARNRLGYYPLFSASECQYYLGLEFAERYKVFK